MESIFTPSEAAAFVQLPTKRVYKELEFKVLAPVSPPANIPFAALIYLQALKDVNFEFSVENRAILYQRLVEALGLSLPSLGIGNYFELKLNLIKTELSELITRFEAWKKQLVSDPDIMGGETVFPGSRLTVRHVGAMVSQGEQVSTIREDYPYLSEGDVEFAHIYFKAYPNVGRPKKHEVPD
jgi:uncharacterized protein (DUF433 family)